MIWPPEVSHIELAQIHTWMKAAIRFFGRTTKRRGHRGRLENLKELVRPLGAVRENLQGLSEHGQPDHGHESDDGAAQKVSIMTLHAAKGAGFPARISPVGKRLSRRTVYG